MSLAAEKPKALHLPRVCAVSSTVYSLASLLNAMPKIFSNSSRRFRFASTASSPYSCEEVLARQVASSGVTGYSA
jgi:hypothetical protein